jgi:acyl carrier protein
MLSPDEGQIRDAIRGYIVENYLLGDDEGLDAEESLLDAGIIDSTGVVELVAFIESVFGINVEDEEMIAENFDSIDRLTRFVVGKRNV